MFAVLAIGLPLALLVVCAVLALGFFEVALAGPEPGSAAGRTIAWQPPLIHDQELFAWAASAARADVRRLLSASPSPATAENIARQISAGTTQAIERSARRPERPSQHDCSSCRHQMIAVTPPEALAIVETVRSRGPHAARRVRDRALENAKRAQDMDQSQYEAAHIVCPLLCDGNSCAADGQRPLHCRGWVALADSQGTAGASPGTAVIVDSFAHTVVLGAYEGLTQELNEQGLDGNRYELNSALAAAFDTPGASALWAKGEPVFAGCKRPS